MPLFNLLRRHPLIVLASLLVAGVALWGGYFLATFDLNNYRVHLAAELGQRLHMPVQLGEAHLELREGGIAFRFSELHIGTPETPVELSADKLWLQLAWHGLLLRKPIFTEVALDTPQLRIAPRPEAPAETPPETTDLDPELLRNLKIRRVEIVNGAMALSWLDPTGQTRTLRLQDLTVNLGDLGLAHTVTYDLAGKVPSQGGEAARLAMTGSVDLPTEGGWQAAVWDFALEAKDVDAAGVADLLPNTAGIAADGRADLALFVKGRLDGTVTFQSELSGQRLRIRPGTAYRQALPVRHLQMAGTWQRLENGHALRQVAMQLDDLRLAGEFTVHDGAGGREIRGLLGNGTLPVDSLRRWLPQDVQADNPLFTRLQPGGLVILNQAALRVALPAGPQQPGAFVLETLEGEVQQLAWSIAPERTVELGALTLQLADGRWQLSGGSGSLAGLPVTFSGTITPQAAAAPQLTLDVASRTTAEQVVALRPAALPAELALTGALTLHGHLAGTLEQLTLAAELDLAELDLRYGDHLHLPPTPGALLTMQGSSTRTALTIDQATLNLPPLQGQLSGTVDWTEAVTVNVAGEVALPDLTAAYPLAPALEKLQLSGAVALDLALTGPLAALQPRISLTAHDVSIPLHGVIADISQLQGRLQLNGKELRSESLSARLGTSPATLQARVADLGAPQLELEVKSPAIHANELIFRSQRTMLRDVSGKLLIDREGITFRPVSVRLDDGTQATVRGTVKNFASPRVDLEIAGDYANVAEIISLWSDENPAAKAARQARPPADAAHFPAIRIEVKAREGDLYGMKFSNASALIVPRAGHLLLHPLDFKVGDGYCTTQVLVDYAEAATMLRASGHVENVDAYAVVNELLHRKSIMRGTLRGDFFLEGELGGRGFLPTSQGNISATVRDGVMRHSPILSSLFSVLNVSQLFSFQLPDINLEGLPFTLLTTELALDKGVLSTEHLVIDSAAMNMAYAGQYDLVTNQLDLLVVAKPLGTVDKVVTRLPIAGWILGGEEKALITAQFKVTGSGDQPKVEAIPITAISKGVLGIFQRTLSLPLRLIEDPAILWGGGGERKN